MPDDARRQARNWTPEEYAWSCAEDMRGWAIRAEEKCRELLARVADLEAKLDEKISVHTADEWLQHRFNQEYDRAEAAERELAAARAANDAVQEWVSAHGTTVHASLLRLLSNLDHALSVPVSPEGGSGDD